MGHLLKSPGWSSRLDSQQPHSDSEPSVTPLSGDPPCPLLTSVSTRHVCGADIHVNKAHEGRKERKKEEREKEREGGKEKKKKQEKTREKQAS